MPLTTIQVEEPTTDAQADEYRKRGQKIWLSYNGVSVIGGLTYIEAARKRRNCKLRPVEPHHIQAAALFRHHWEKAGYALRAADTTQEPVDVSSKAHDGGVAHVVDGRRKHASGVKQLGYRSQLVVDCVCRERTLPQMVKDRNHGERLTKRDLEERAIEIGDEILVCLDELAEHWDLSTKTKVQRAA